MKTINRNFKSNFFDELYPMQQVQISIAKKYIDHVSSKKKNNIFQKDTLFATYFESLCNEYLQIKSTLSFHSSKNISNAHFRFCCFLDSHIEDIFEMTNRLDILKLYSQEVNRPLIFLANELVSNDDSITVTETANLVLEKYSNLLLGKCFEVGAGTSPLSKLLKMENNPDYILSDIKAEYLKQKSTNLKVQYDMNNPMSIDQLDCIFSTKSIHLSKDKVNTLQYFNDSLKPGGCLIVSNANKFLDTNKRHPYEFALSFFPGFVESGGFIDIETYLEYLTYTSLKLIEANVYQNEAGRVFWIVVAQKI